MWCFLDSFPAPQAAQIPRQRQLATEKESLEPSSAAAYRPRLRRSQRTRNWPRAWAAGPSPGTRVHRLFAGQGSMEHALRRQESPEKELFTDFWGSEALRPFGSPELRTGPAQRGSKGKPRTPQIQEVHPARIARGFHNPFIEEVKGALKEACRRV